VGCGIGDLGSERWPWGLDSRRERGRRVTGGLAARRVSRGYWFPGAGNAANAFYLEFGIAPVQVWFNLNGQIRPPRLGGWYFIPESRPPHRNTGE
jgi:hypothetical protein